MNKPTLLILSILTLIALSSIGYGAVCTTSLDNMPCNITSNFVADAFLDLDCPPDDCFIINNSVTVDLNGAILRGNDTNGNGAIIIGANNVVLDCNGATLKGNRTTGSSGIFIASFDDVTIKNCNITRYEDAGIRIKPDADNNLIFNNTFIDMIKGTYVHFSNSGNSIVSNTYINATADFSAVDNVLIENNTFDLLNFRIGITIRTRSNGFIIKGNSINNSQFMFIQISGNSQNIQIEDNIMQNSDRGIDILDSSNINMTNNTLINLTSLFDDYATGIVLSNISNFRAINNTINYGSAGILIKQSSNVTIDNNNFQQVSISDKISRSKSDKFEPTCAICILQKYRGFFTGYPLPSSNINISGNTFNSNVQTYLRLQGTTVVTHDLSSFWYRRFNISGYSNETGADEFYNNNLFDRLSNVRDVTFTENFVFFKSGIEGSGASLHTTFNYSLSKTVMKFTNTNKTDDRNLSLFNLTDQPDSQFMQYFNGTSTTPIENVNSLTESIPPNNISCVYSYPTSTQPKFLSKNTDECPDYSFTSTELTITCNGAGGHILTNMDVMKGKSNTYSVFKDGVFIGISQTNEYTLPSCSVWSFIPRDRGARVSNLLRNGVAVLIAVALLAAFALPLTTGQDITITLIITFILIFIMGFIAINFIFTLF